MDILNAKIADAIIEIDDRGILSVWIFLELSDGGNQAFGGYALYLPKEFNHHNIKSPAGHWIYRICKIAEVNRWNDLKGKTVRIKREPGFSGKIKVIGNIIKDDWFCPEDDFKDA